MRQIEVEDGATALVVCGDKGIYIEPPTAEYWKGIEIGSDEDNKVGHSNNIAAALRYAFLTRPEYIQTLVDMYQNEVLMPYLKELEDEQRVRAEASDDNPRTDGTEMGVDGSSDLEGEERGDQEDT